MTFTATSRLKAETYTSGLDPKLTARIRCEIGYRSVDRSQLATQITTLTKPQRTFHYVLHRVVIGRCYKRHQATDFLDFLKRIDAEMPAGPDVHLVTDNYATHKTPGIKAWLARRPHWHIHFTPTSASWINQVERWFAELTRKQLQRGDNDAQRFT